MDLDPFIIALALIAVFWNPPSEVLPVKETLGIQREKNLISEFPDVHGPLTSMNHIITIHPMIHLYIYIYLLQHAFPVETPCQAFNAGHVAPWLAPVRI